ncbi:MAG: DUF6498-containing protein [Gammaproteobacteria bacterium]|nr:DUF6498-containing protein [Gammaproteobacteria bacterium]
MSSGKFRLDLPQLALLLANLLPVFGVLFLDWDVGSIVVLYWAENLIAGAYTLLKMLTVGKLRALPVMLFFTIHYGGFCAAHGLFVLELTQFAGETIAQEHSWPGPLVLIEMFIDLSRQVLAAAPREFLWACLALLISHGASFLLLFIGQQEFRWRTVKQLMHAPYSRITVLHIAVIAGGFLVQKMGSPLGLLLALVALKTCMDIMLHNRSHKDTGQSARASHPPVNPQENNDGN